MPFTAKFWSFSSALSEKKADRVDRVEIVIRRVAEVSEESGSPPEGTEAPLFSPSF